MKVRELITGLVILLTVSTASYSQKTKFLIKSDGYFNAGSYAKAQKSLAKYRSSLTKLGPTNKFLPGYYIREARINLAQGVLTGFEASVTNAITVSLAANGETTAEHMGVLLDVASIYIEYGNYRIAREYIDKARAIMEAHVDVTDLLKSKILLLEAEALINQGFCNEALSMLRSQEAYLAGRAVEKETYVEDGNIKSRRVPDNELGERFSDYAQCLILIGYAYSTKGDRDSVDIAFNFADGWLRGKTKYLGEASMIPVEARYYWANYLTENGNERRDPKLEWDNILSELKRRASPTNELAHKIYLAYLQQLQANDNRARFQNVRLEYQRNIDKYFPKSSLIQINLKAVEFDSKLNRDKTKDLENDALKVLNDKNLPRNYKTTVRTLKFLTDVAITEKRYTNAESYLTQISDISKDLYGEQAPHYHLARILLANFYIDYTNRIADAKKIYEESYYGVLEKEIHNYHKDHLEILNHLAVMHEMTDDYAKANSTLRKANDVAWGKYSNTDILYAVELNYLANLFLKLGDYDAAEKDINKSLEVLDLKENRSREAHTSTEVNALEIQAKLYGIKGLFDEAQANLTRTSRIIKKSKVPITSELSTAEQLTSLLILLGSYSDADKLLSTLFAEYTKLYGASSIRMIQPLVERGTIQLANGDYTDAERTAQQAYDIAKKAFGEKSTKAAPCQKLLSAIYYSIGDYDRAQEMITLAMQSQEKQFGRNHVEVARSISELALIRFHKGDDRKQVERLMLESQKIIADKLGTTNPQYADILQNLAVLYISDKKYDIAFGSLTQAENIWKARAGAKNNIHLASIYTLTGDVYYQTRNYRKSIEFYEKSKKLYETFFSNQHPEYVRVLSKMSKVEYMQKNYKASKKLIEDALASYELFIKEYFPAQSEQQKAKFWKKMQPDFEFYNTLAFSNLEDFKDLTGKVYNYQLLTKALLLSSSIKMRERILNSTDEELKSKFSDWLDKKETLTRALSMTPDQLLENEIDPGTLQQEVERLEKELSQKSEEFGQGFENQRITFTDVVKSLGSNEAAIEMVRYRHFDHAFTDSIVYAALYLKPGYTSPKVIMLEDGYKMESRYFKFYRNAITGKIPDNVSYNIFWAPINREIGLASTIYLSADGVYNQINLEAIPTPDGKYIIDNSNIVLISNTRDLFINKRKSKISVSENTASMFGNPTFYLTASANKNITPLPGTEKEVTQLEFLLKQKGWITKDYMEISATEEKVKELDNPKIFHIATHGLYRPTPTLSLQDEMVGNEAALVQNPLLRTGLLLKGAGDLLDKTEYNYNIDNGILTAMEAMNLNLDKTDLVVLSACETGLGDVEQGEGVYGLQRAFLVAGAKVLVMSMFKVDDEATQKLMVKFYQKYINSGRLRESFTEAKKELRNEYPEPIFWGAFIMIGLE